MKQEYNHTNPDNHPLERWKELAERYFEAQTNDEEEQQLRCFLMTEEAGKEFDELRAVMGFLATGKAFHQPVKKRMFPLYATRWIAAVVIGCVAGTVVWQTVDRHQNICVAYIYGEKCTDAQEVMSQLKLSLRHVRNESEEMSVENQLNDIFKTLEEGDVTTASK